MVGPIVYRKIKFYNEEEESQLKNPILTEFQRLLYHLSRIGKNVPDEIV